MTYVLAFILGVLGLVCIIASRQPGQRFDLHDYQGDERGRFIDGAKSSLLIMCGVMSFVMAVVVAGAPESFVGMLPLVMCMGIGILPISILSAYNRSFWQRRLFGGYQPYLRKALLNEDTAVPKLTPEDYQPPKTAVWFAGATAAMAMSVTIYVFQFRISWTGAEWVHIAFSLGMALVLGFGVFMSILSAITSRRIEKARAKALERERNSQHTAG